MDSKKRRRDTSPDCTPSADGSPISPKRTRRAPPTSVSDASSMPTVSSQKRKRDTSPDCTPSADGSPTSPKRTRHAPLNLVSDASTESTSTDDVNEDSITSRASACAYIKMHEGETRVYEAAIRDIVDALGKRQEWLAGLKTQLNESLPVYRLPPELLFTIFSTAIAELTKKEFLIALTHVCRLWRAVALDCPLLWSSLIDLNWHPGQVSAFISRSKKLPITVSTNFKDRPLFQETLRVCESFFAEDMPRVCELALKNPPDIRNVSPALQLKKLILEETFDAKTIWVCPFLDKSYAPVLEHLKLNTTLFLFTSLAPKVDLPFLKSLEFTSSWTASPEATLTMLEGLPRLESLKLHCLSHQVVPHTTGDKVPLSHLQDIWISSMNIPSSINFLSRLSIPRAKIIHLNVVCAMDDATSTTGKISCSSEFLYAALVMDDAEHMKATLSTHAGVTASSRRVELKKFCIGQPSTSIIRKFCNALPFTNVEVLTVKHDTGLRRLRSLKTLVDEMPRLHTLRLSQMSLHDALHLIALALDSPVALCQLKTIELHNIELPDIVPPDVEDDDKFIEEVVDSGIGRRCNIDDVIFQDCVNATDVRVTFMLEQFNGAHFPS